jgi:hypothetical protein
VRLASVRRSLFAGEAERAKFLNHLAAGTRDILRTQRGLGEHANYHEFCRLLGRLKTNYQLSELVSTASVCVMHPAAARMSTGDIHYSHTGLILLRKVQHCRLSSASAGLDSARRASCQAAEFTQVLTQLSTCGRWVSTATPSGSSWWRT